MDLDADARGQSEHFLRLGERFRLAGIDHHVLQQSRSVGADARRVAVAADGVSMPAGQKRLQGRDDRELDIGPPGSADDDVAIARHELVDEVLAAARLCAGRAGWLKVGLEAFVAEGLRVIDRDQDADWVRLDLTR